MKLPFAGSYYTLAVVYSISLILVSFLKVPEVKKSNVIEEKRPLREVCKTARILARSSQCNGRLRGDEAY